MKRMSWCGLLTAVAWVGCASTPPPTPEPEATEATDPPAVAAESPAETSTPDAEPPPAPVANAPDPAPEPTPPEPAPATTPAPAPAPDDGGIPGANLTMSKVTADGLELQKVSCKADGLGFLGAVVIASSLSKKKTALKGCAGGKSPRVKWSFTGGKITSVEVEGIDAKAAACVAKTLKNAAAPGTGQCAATLVL